MCNERDQIFIFLLGVHIRDCTIPLITKTPQMFSTLVIKCYSLTHDLKCLRFRTVNFDCQVVYKMYI